MIILGTVYFVMSVGAAKYTNLFLAELKLMLAEAGLGLEVVSVIYIGVGLCMFLLPPVPGVPVYLTGGILLSAMAEKKFRPDMCLIPDASPLFAGSTLDCQAQAEKMDVPWGDVCTGVATGAIWLTFVYVLAHVLAHVLVSQRTGHASPRSVTAAQTTLGRTGWRRTRATSSWASDTAPSSHS